MRLSNHVIERFSHRYSEFQEMITNVILELLRNVKFEEYHGEYGVQYVAPIKEGVFICNKEKTAVITFIAKEKISQKELRRIYHRRY